MKATSAELAVAFLLQRKDVPAFLVVDWAREPKLSHIFMVDKVLNLGS